MTVAQRLLRTALPIGIACGVIGMVVHVSAHGRAYVLAGTRPVGLVVEVLLVSLAMVAAVLIESASRRVLVFAAATAFLLEELANPAATRSAFVLGLAATGLAWGLLALALVVHPERPIEWFWRALVTAGGIASGPLVAAAWQPDRHGCADCPSNALALFDSARWSGGLARWGAIAMLLAAAMALGSVVGRRSVYSLSEQAATLALSIGMAFSLLPRIHHGVDGVPSSAARLLAAWSLAASALALAFPDLQRAHRRAAIRRLATGLAAAPAPGRLREELARAVGDPTMTIAFPIGIGALVDDEGLPVRLPEQAATRIMREGRHLATVFHAPGAFDDDDDVASLTRVAGLALENERARAEQKAQARELRASRRRLVAASDRERRRLEHDLHDGAQQQLVSLLLAVGNIPAATATDGTLAAAQHHLQAAITELRTLTHGLFPAVLTQKGLAPAIEDLELSSTAVVEILELPTQPAPPLVESTAYLAAALAVASAESSVQLRIRRTPEAVAVEARGATVGDSLEWRALAERVAALEGQLIALSDGIEVILPCES